MDPKELISLLKDMEKRIRNHAPVELMRMGHIISVPSGMTEVEKLVVDREMVNWKRFRLGIEEYYFTFVSR